MTSITSYGYGALQTQRADSSFRTLKADLADLNNQLATGKRATTYAGLGSSAIRSLSGRQTLAAIEAYAANVTDGQFRAQVMSTGIGQIDKIARSLTTDISGSYESTGVGQTSAIVSASDGLKQILDILNTEVDGRHLFSGRSTDVEPVVNYDLIVNGDGTRAGLKQLIAERRGADLGADGLGRVTMSDTATGIAVAEEAAGLPFGMKIAGATSTSAALTATTSAGPPPSATLAVASQPASGAEISLSLRLPDGSTTTLTFRAEGTSDGDTIGFAIGANAAATAANLRAAVRGAVGETAQTELAAASALGASQAFFAGSPGNPPARVPGPPYETATATVPGTAANTVIWYQGDDGAGSARETAPVRTSDGASVAIGARANEPGFRAVLAALGALVGQDFPAGDAAAQQRYAATTQAIADSLEDAMKPIVTDFATATRSLDAAEERLRLGKAQVEDTLAGIEDADPNEVAMKLLATQTRLQASYQTTSVIAKLSLVNFI